MNYHLHRANRVASTADTSGAKPDPTLPWITGTGCRYILVPLINQGAHLRLICGRCAQMTDSMTNGPTAAEARGISGYVFDK